MIIGIIIIVIGLVFLLQSLGVLTGDVWKIIWPCLIIVVGLAIINKERGCCCGADCEKPKK